MATRHTRRRIIVIQAADLAAANGHAKQVDRGGGEHTFRVGLSATGAPPWTHYWCNWALTPEEETDLLARLAALGVRVRTFDGFTTTPAAALSAVGGGLRPR